LLEVNIDVTTKLGKIRGNTSKSYQIINVTTWYLFEEWISYEDFKERI